LRFPLPEMVAGAATAFSGRRLPRRGYPSKTARPAPRGKYGVLFYWLALPFHNRNYRAFNHFLAG